MSVRHHPSGDVLFEHACGSLHPDRRLVVQAHLGACPVCAGEAAATEAVGGVLFDSLPAATLAPDALDRALARIERPAKAARPAPATPDDWIAVPDKVAFAARHRRRWAAPGVWVARISGGQWGRRSYLLRVAQGMSMPRHTHRGVEMVCVLKGAFLDRGEIFGPGDFAESDEAVEHRPEVAGDEECVCLVAVDTSLIARDWVGRLFQPFVRI